MQLGGQLDSAKYSINVCVQKNRLRSLNLQE